MNQEIIKSKKPYTKLEFVEATQRSSMWLQSLMKDDTLAFDAVEALNKHSEEVEKLVLKNSNNNNVPTNKEPYSFIELRDATMLSSFALLTMLNDDVLVIDFRQALVLHATEVEKLLLGDQARGFEQ